MPARTVAFRNTRLSTTIAVLREIEPPLLADALHKMLGGMPDFFTGEATILDCGQLPPHPTHIDWTGLLSLFRRHQLQPIGVCNLPAEHVSAAKKAGLAVFSDTALFDTPPTDTPPPKIATAPKPEAAKPASPPAAQENTLFVDRPLRSGQQIYARGSDLVLLAGMSSGAEVIADGSIHCFGPLRGRVLAGAQGNTAARVLATNFGPELISIAGVYRTFENGIPEKFAGRPTQTRLSDPHNEQKLVIDTLQLD